jgi:Fe-S-cluster containining protein
VADTSGKISSCSSTGCGWKCCGFQQGNYIVLHPGELETAQATGQSIAHLQITDADYHGGQKAVCTARDTGSCDSGLKPLDCKSYPFFPANGDNELLVKGRKCPIALNKLSAHATAVQEAWDGLASQNSDIRDWLDKVELVGYSEPLRPLEISALGLGLQKVA